MDVKFFWEVVGEQQSDDATHLGVELGEFHFIFWIFVVWKTNNDAQTDDATWDNEAEYKGSVPNTKSQRYLDEDDQKDTPVNRNDWVVA